MFGPKNFGLKEDLELAKKALYQVGLGEEFYEKSLFPEIRVMNATMIIGIIAFDRLLNQIANYRKLKLQEK